MTDVLAAAFPNGAGANGTTPMISPSPNPSSTKRRRDGSTATFDSASSFDLNESRDTVHDAATSTPSLRHNFSAQTETPLHMREQPKYEAFVMTGDKILNLNPKISPHYAKLQRTQLPPNVEVENQPKYSKAFENFPSTTYQKKKYSRSHQNSSEISVSNSENLLHDNNNHHDAVLQKTLEMSTEPCASTAEITSISINPQFSASSINRVNSLPREAPSVKSAVHESDNNLSVMHELSSISQSRPTPQPPLPSPFNYAGLRIDAALRDFLEHVTLTGESDERARILKHFADRYNECNPTLFDGPDSIHALACALLLLNTDLHGNITNKKMTMCEFIDNLAYTGFNYDRGLLKTLYAKIKSQPFKSAEQAPVEKPKKLSVHSVANHFVRQITDQVDYFHGWVMLKEVYDRDGKRTPFGRRQWRMYFATVRGLVLYLHKNERGFEASRFEIFQNCIRLHHALAEVPRDYTKKSHTSSPEELSKWVNAVNFVAASLSTPALPEPSGSQSARFQMSPLPPAVSSLPIRDQLEQHREKYAEISHLLALLRESAPPMKAKGKAVYEYFYRERFLEREQLRYKTYVDVLLRNIASSSRPESRNNVNGTLP
ncbi:PH and SEC7 domain-containing protein 3 [Aphelenchoides fujianensis]|nr:PH and SEC7 domain-containing protein 3 [Aphelenchoides fujianensis]